MDKTLAWIFETYSFENLLNLFKQQCTDYSYQNLSSTNFVFLANHPFSMSGGIRVFHCNFNVASKKSKKYP